MAIMIARLEFRRSRRKFGIKVAGYSLTGACALPQSADTRRQRSEWGRTSPDAAEEIGSSGRSAHRSEIGGSAVQESGMRNGAYGADKFGLEGLEAVHWNVTAPRLYEHAIAAGEAKLAYGGALVADTGVHTGRSPKDKFIVKDAMTEHIVWWDNNGSITPQQFHQLHQDFLAHAEGKVLFAQDLYAGADPRHRLKTRVFTEYAWHSLFIRNLLMRPESSELRNFVPTLTILDLPSFKADPKRHGVRSETIIAIDFSRRMVLIGGTSYAGEMKKAVFTTLNYLLPSESVMPMHCSANAGPGGDVALFFGLSGTGKTTLSADPSRTLLGDDEHGWAPPGIFNFEGGCYAKTIRLSAEAEPEIYATTHRFGTVLENVVLDPETRVPDFDDGSKTENTRCAYPLEFIPNASKTGRGGPPSNIIMLTADAFGVMPPIAKLTPAQAMYHFLSGYTAKVAGTEKGLVGVEPEFSTCFGVAVPTAVPGIDTKILNPDQTWADRKAFDETARKLVGMFQKNFAKYEQTVDADVRAAAPEVRLAAE